MDIAVVRSRLLAQQASIVEALEREGGDAFIVDRWQREPGGKLEGDGVSRLVEGGALLERGGVGFSHVRGAASPACRSRRSASRSSSIRGIHTCRPRT